MRPTSETVIGEFMAKWIQSYRDLPLLLNQWANVVRWELRPRLFLRTTEFLWQEGHTAHATEADAHAYAMRILHDVYAGLHGATCWRCRSSSASRRRGSASPARPTRSRCEAMMGDGKALQMGTSHELGQNFARAFGIEFLDDTGAQQTGVDHVVGLVDPDGRWADHGPRRRRRPPRAARGSRRCRSSCSRCATRATSWRAAAALTDELVAPPGVRAQLDDRTRTSRSGGGSRTGSSRVCRSGSRSGPATSPTASATLVRRIVTGDEDRKTAVPLDGVVGAVTARARAPAVRAARRGRPRCASGAPPTSRRSTTARDAAADGWARIPWDAVGVDGRGRARAGGRHRAVPGPRRRLPARRRRRARAGGPRGPRLLRPPCSRSSPRCRRCWPSWRASSPPAAARPATSSSSPSGTASGPSCSATATRSRSAAATSGR